MTFNDNADISGGKVGRRGRTGLILGGGGGGLLVVGLIILSQVLGVDLTPLAGDGSGAEPSAENIQCDTGAQANADLDCRMKGAAAALDTYWVDEAPSLGVQYTSPQFALFTDQTSTGCGAATSATGPFYCPADQILYVDTGFFDDLRTQYGSSGGPLAEMYVVAHEWGHHIQNLGGVLKNQSQATGPGSESIRIELQADCFAGAWVGAASTTKDENGVPFLKPVTETQLKDALSAASAVGDDRIQAQSGVVNPETWTHGSSEQRQRWFLTGYRSGATGCDTFTPSTANL
jgi:predicted metalloprotease